MKTWIILLRGVNVGGNNKLSMAHFREALSGLGFEDVQTYIQSGNAVISAVGSREDIQAQVGELLSDQFAITAPVIVRNADELAHALAQNPYPRAHDNPTSLHLFFLATPARDVDMDAMQAAATKGEEFTIIDQTLYFHTPNGMGKSDMARKLDRLVGVPMTGRSLRSCLKILEMAQEGKK